MARYRKGNRFLSEEEYRKEVNDYWVVGLFLIGAIISGYFVNKGLADFDIPKWLKFTVVILISLIGGGILGKLYKQIQLLIAVLVMGGILLAVGSLIWRIL